MRLFPAAVRNRLLWATAASIVLPWIAGEFVKRWQQTALTHDALHDERIVDFIVAGSIFTCLSLVLAVAFGCWVTAVMKGPRFTADSFPVDSPRRKDD